jgi:hypothetical protein
MSQDPRHSGQLLGQWTARKGGLGVTKAMFCKLKANSGTGASMRWYVSKDTFAKVWPVLASSRRRRRKQK